MNKLAIIDDEESLSSVLKQLIQICGQFDIETFSCVEDFLKRNEEQVFEIVFSDLNMPGISGLECANILSLKQRPNKFVLMSGDNLDEISKQAYPIDFYLYKPFTLKSLRNCLL